MGAQRWTTGRIALVVVVAVAAAGVAVAVLLWPSDRTRVVQVDEAVDNFRASTVPDDTDAGDPEATVSASTVPATAPSLVEPGVYRYATTGWEDIDALNGARHDYPAETAITVTAEGCGVRLRWDALRERRDEWRLCPTEEGIELQPDAIQYHEFFQQPQLEHLDCDRSVVVVPAGDPPAEPVVQSCMLEDDPWVATWTIVRATGSLRGANALTLTMCAAKDRAQKRTSRSPRANASPMVRLNSPRPTVARTTPSNDSIPGLFLSKRAERMGTITTDRPVMNPALEALV